MTREEYNKMIKKIQSKVNKEFSVITERDLQEIIKEFSFDENSIQALMDYLDSKNIMIDKEEKSKENDELRLDRLEEEVNAEEHSEINEIVNENSRNYTKIFKSLVTFLRENHIIIPNEEIVGIAGKIDIYDCELSEVERIIRSDFEKFGILEQIDHSKIKSLAKRIYSNISSTDKESTALEDPVKMYLRDIAQYPVLTRTQERIKFEKLDLLREKQKLLKESLNTTQDEKTKEELASIEEEIIELKKDIVNHNLRLVVSIAKRSVGKGVDFLDLIQEGNDGLMKACERFEVSKGFKFSTYATWWINQCVGRSIANNSRIIRVPVHAHEQINKMRRHIREYTQEFGRTPNDEELAELMELPVEKIKELKVVEMNNSLVSLDQPIVNGEGDQDTTIGDMQKDETEISAEELVFRQELVKIVGEMYDELPYKERFVIGNRFGTFEEFSSNEIDAMKLKYLLSRMTKKRFSDELARVEEKYVKTNSRLNEMSRNKVASFFIPKIKTNKDKKEQLEDLINIEKGRNPYPTIMTEEYRDALETVAEYNLLFPKDKVLHKEPLNVGTYLLLKRDYQEELDIIGRYFTPGSNKTLEEVGGIMGVTRERIRQIEKTGLRKVRVKSRCRLKDFSIEEA